jgi:glycosyltransferase involved in cell wall biosynthesis
VLIIYKSVPQYRRRFFELLRERLAEEGVELRLLYGQPTAEDASKKDAVDMAWATKRRNLVVRIGSREVLWQRGFDMVRDADLVIIEQASKLLVNHFLVPLNALHVKKVAFWGHGRSVNQHRLSRLGEALKHLESRHVHWWFAYNETSASIVRDWGYPPDRITLVQNAIDTRQLIAWREALTDEALHEVRQRLGISGDQVCLFTGAMYPEKRLPFLISACMRIRELVPGFEMVFVGGGPDERIVAEAAASHSWIHYVGPAFDGDRVPYFALARLALMPGGVGLGIVDSLALEVPLVTTDVPYHGPEIEYLENGVNGVIIKETTDPTDYADAVAALLLQPSRLESLRKGCRLAADRYTIEEMVERFAAGTLDALSAGNGTL